MRSMGGELWGPRPLPHTLADQLAQHGFAHGDAAECARQLAHSDSPVESALLFVDLGACKFLEGDVDGAVAAWRHAMTGEDDVAAAQAMFNLGLLYEHLFLHDQAIALLSSAANRGGARFEPAAIMAAARCHHATGSNDAAMESMALLAQTSMAHGSDTEELAQILFGLGEIAHDSGRSDRAERAWRAASSGPASPCQQAATEQLLALLMDQGDDDGIIELLERLPHSVIAPHASQLLERIETLHRRDHQLQAAALANAIDGTGFAAVERFRLADARRQVGLINGAIDELEVLLNDQRSEVQQQAAFSLGEMYRDHDMADPARTMYERALGIEDDFWAPKAALALGDLAAQRGDREHALEYWIVASTTPTRQVSNAARERIDSAFSEPGDHPTTPVHDDIAAPEVVAVEEPVQVVSLDALEDDLLLEPHGDVAAPEVVAVEEPVQVVSLDALEDDLARAPVKALPTPPIAPVVKPDSLLASTPEPPASVRPAATSSVFRSLSDPNPYASLAPEGHESDIAPSTRNPYAELAPNFDEAAPDPDVQPGDWESMLDGWTPTSSSEQPSEPQKKRPSAFSRYT